MAEGRNGAEDISVHLTGDTADRFRRYRAAQIGPKVTDSALGAHLIGIALATMPTSYNGAEQPQKRRKAG